MAKVRVGDQEYDAENIRVRNVVQADLGIDGDLKDASYNLLHNYGTPEELEAAAEAAKREVEVQQCDVCGGTNTMSELDLFLAQQAEADVVPQAVLDEEGYTGFCELQPGECGWCDGSGKSPTLRELRRTLAIIASDIAACRKYIAKGELTIEAVANGDQRVSMVAMEPGASAADAWRIARTDPDALQPMPTEIAPQVQLQLRLEVDQAKAYLARREHAQVAVQAMHDFVVRLRHYRKEWERSERPAPEPVVPHAQPLQAPTCHCGKPGTVQDDAGAWHCKRHGHALGLLAPPPVPEELPLCDWCERRQARRTWDDYNYCGPCADEAQLPPEEQEVAA